MKISGRIVRVTNTKFVPDRLVIYEGEAITFKLDVTDEKYQEEKVYQVRDENNVYLYNDEKVQNFRKLCEF